MLGPPFSRRSCVRSRIKSPRTSEHISSKQHIISRHDTRLSNRRTAAETHTPPLQFVYEAANCRLFYQFEDALDITHLWKYVANVPGGTVTANNLFPLLANDTVPYTGDHLFLHTVLLIYTVVLLRIYTPLLLRIYTPLLLQIHSGIA